MAIRQFINDKKYIHIPVCDEHPYNYKYVKVFDGDKIVNEFHIGVAYAGKQKHFYVPLYLGNYHSATVTLECDDNVTDDFFDGFILGDNPINEPTLYPDLYSEPTRQRFHFSAKRGWLNDPNGLFYKDGKFNVYFQHNPFGSRHGGVNVSWGHAVTEDLVHFTEYPDAIMPFSSKWSVASGSCFVDNDNILKKGNGTVIAAYTALQAFQYNGRPSVTQSGGQMLLYSIDDGMTFEYFENNPIISVPDKEYWRDPKLLKTDDGLIAIVYEPIEDKKRTTFYSSKDGVKWEKVSSGEEFHECPDFFEIEEYDGKERLFVMYGGAGLYSVGKFENFKFTAIEQGGYLDYGDGESIYAGQTFSNYPSKKERYHIAWLLDSGMRCYIAEGYEFKGIGFNSSMSLICKLTLNNTPYGYRVFRTPNDNLVNLRYGMQRVQLKDGMFLDCPAEYEFSLDGKNITEIKINGHGFTYFPQENKIKSTSNKEYVFCCNNPVVRLFVDTRSVEFFVGNEISLTFFAIPKIHEFHIGGVNRIDAEKYKLKTIW